MINLSKETIANLHRSTGQVNARRPSDSTSSSITADHILRLNGMLFTGIDIRDHRFYVVWMLGEPFKFHPGE